MLRPYQCSLKRELQRLRLDCGHFTESEDEISDRVDQGIVALVNCSSENDYKATQKLPMRQSCCVIINFFVIFGCLIGSGSISSGSAKSVSTLRSESRLEESLSSSSFPGSPKLRGKSPPINGINGTAYQQQQVSGSSRVASTSPFPISRSEESLQVWSLEHHLLR